MARMPALSYSHGVSDVRLLGETIGANLERTVARVGDRDAVVSCQQDVRLSYAELDAAVDRLACGLIAAGVAKGDRVGIWAPNCVEWVLVQFATAKAGAILVNINPAYRTHEVEYALRQSGVKLLVSAPAFKTSDYRGMIEDVRGGLPELQAVGYLESSEWEELAASPVDADALRERSASLAFDDPINIQYTSGTTGFPKGATLSHHNILNNGFFVAELCDFTEADRVCLPVPFYHCFGMVMGNLGAVTHGACIVIPAPGFEPEATLRAVAGERCTSLYGVPTMFIAELEHPEFASFDLSSLRTGIMAGAPCPIEVMKRVVRDMHMEQVTIAYGMTETSPVSFQSGTHDSIERRVSTVGRIHPHLQVKVVDPQGCVVPVGSQGEILTRGYSVMKDYWDDPERTRDVIDDAGWMHTGDLGVIDAEGYCNITGRLKDMLIRGGENIYPREIEEFLYRHPKIQAAQVFGVPDPRFGEEVCAWIQLRPGAAATDQEIREFCSGQIAQHKIPRYVRFVSAFPLTVTGKVQKYMMREQMCAELNTEAERTA